MPPKGKSTWTGENVWHYVEGKGSALSAACLASDCGYKQAQCPELWLSRDDCEATNQAIT